VPSFTALKHRVAVLNSILWRTGSQCRECNRRWSSLGEWRKLYEQLSTEHFECYPDFVHWSQLTVSYSNPIWNQWLSTLSCLRRLTLKTAECDVVRAGGSYSPNCVSHMLIKRQRTVQNHTQDFKFISRGYCAASNGDSLWKLWDVVWSRCT